MIDYNKENADELARDFEKLTGIDINSTSRETKTMINRTLFYKILIDVNFMNDRMISDWFESRGVKRNRASIFQSLKKISIYYKTYPSFRNIYNVYFNDKAEEFLTLEQTQQKRLNDSKQNIHTNTLKKDKDALELLIDTIPQDRRGEIREIVSLRVKSWSWKTKDECKIIEGDTSLEGYCF
jgi:galactose mutarotase-like enzyme